MPTDGSADREAAGAGGTQAEHMHRAEDNGDGQAKETETIQVVIAKQRNGPTGVVSLLYRRNFCAFENSTPNAPAVDRLAWH